MPNGKRGDYGFEVDEKALAERLCLPVIKALKERQGFFSRGLEMFLPQFNLPDELESNPEKREESQVTDALTASNYLWTIVFFERLNQSKEIILNGQTAWHNQKTRWIFDPFRVAIAPEDEIGKILRRIFKFNLKSYNENPPETRLRNNARRLMRDYDGDPRNIIIYKRVSEARRHLMQFEGIGTGIANLFIHYMIDRSLASPIDPENSLLKVDIHKGKLPIITGVTKPFGTEIYRDDPFVSVHEQAYSSISKQHGINPSLLDAALWVIGSQGCKRNDYSVCQNNCPVFHNCSGNIRENKNTGRYIVLTKDGKPIDIRRNKHASQQHVFHYN